MEIAIPEICVEAIAAREDPVDRVDFAAGDNPWKVLGSFCEVTPDNDITAAACGLETRDSDTDVFAANSMLPVCCDSATKCSVSVVSVREETTAF